MQINKIQLANAKKEIDTFSAWNGAWNETIKFYFPDGGCGETEGKFPSYVNLSDEELRLICKAEFGREDYEQVEYYPC